MLYTTGAVCLDGRCESFKWCILGAPRYALFTPHLQVHKFQSGQRFIKTVTEFSRVQDTGFADGVQWAIFLAIMWTMWQAYSYLGTMGF